MSKSVFITGVSGYLGQWVLELANKQGYKIRAALRRPHEKLQDRFPNVDFRIVPDLTVEGAYSKNNLFDGIDYIIHIAGPSTYQADPNDYKKSLVDPAVGMLRVLLNDSLKAESVKRIVLTSSAAALVSPLVPYTRVDDESEYPLPLDFDQAVYEDFFRGYGASKALPVKLGREFIASHKPHFDLQIIYPTLLVGRPLFDDDRDINGNTSDRILTAFRSDVANPPYNFPLHCLHVRDGAVAHLKALNPEVKGNQNFFLDGEYVPYNKVPDIVKKLRPDISIAERELDGTLENTSDSSKSVRELGIEYTPFEECVKDVLDFYC